MEFHIRRWLQISFFNLLIVSLLGSLLRYKIAFSFPLIEQNYLLHGHSHFAFAGWITQALMALMVQWLSQYKGNSVFKKYRWLLYANLLTAYGMLVSFIVEGYAFWSILFSTLSIFVSYWFAILFWKDLKTLGSKSISCNWYKAALVFSIISSLGAFSLAFMMANKFMHERWNLGAVYFFLHFQYNGWFFFAGMGLLVSLLEKTIRETQALKYVFWFFCLACGPAFFLSALWMEIPLFIYFLVVLAALAQIVAWAMFLRLLKKYSVTWKTRLPINGRILFLLSGIALTIKLILQLGSTHPALSQLAFGFRPIVIGYLHLVLLGVITIFILGYSIAMKLVDPGKYFRHSLWIFIAGIMINEVLLMLQGVAGLSYSIVPFINESLFITAVIMFAGLLILNLQIRTKKLIP